MHSCCMSCDICACVCAYVRMCVCVNVVSSADSVTARHKREKRRRARTVSDDERHSNGDDTDGLRYCSAVLVTSLVDFIAR